MFLLRPIAVHNHALHCVYVYVGIVCVCVEREWGSKFSVYYFHCQFVQVVEVLGQDLVTWREYEKAHSMLGRASSSFARV